MDQLCRITQLEAEINWKAQINEAQFEIDQVFQGQAKGSAGGQDKQVLEPSKMSLTMGEWRLQSGSLKDLDEAGPPDS